MKLNTRSNPTLLLQLVCMVAIIGALTACTRSTEESPTNKTATSQTASTKTNDAHVKPFQPEELPSLLLQGKNEIIHKQFDTAFQQQVSLQDMEQLAAFHEDIQSYTLQSTMKLGDSTKYIWTDEHGTKGIQAVFNPEGRISGLMLHPLVTYPETDAKKTTTTFALPFHGDWFTFWGGTNVLVNYHYEHPSQRYAYDFVQQKNGSSYEGDATKLSSYYAFGQPMLASAPGKVVELKNQIPDNEPVGTMNEKEPAGNYVVIDHGNGEYSMYAHLQKGSVKVKVGDQVQTGDTLGLCGNSGNSSEPHLHFQVSNGINLFQSESVRIQFENDAEYVQGTTIKAP